MCNYSENGSLMVVGDCLNTAGLYHVQIFLFCVSGFLSFRLFVLNFGLKVDEISLLHFFTFFCFVLFLLASLILYAETLKLLHSTNHEHPWDKVNQIQSSLRMQYITKYNENFKCVYAVI